MINKFVCSAKSVKMRGGCLFSVTWTFKNIFSKFKHQLENRQPVVRNQTDHRLTFKTFEISKYYRKLNGAQQETVTVYTDIIEDTIGNN
jgi:hypothetical protein